jgi:hypothetical protein
MNLRAFMDQMLARRATDNSIGALLLGMGFITKQQLLAAIVKKAQSNTDTLIGEILIAQGAVTRTQVERAMTQQRKQRGVIGTEDYVQKMKNLTAGAHARAETVQALLAEATEAAERVCKEDEAVLPSGADTKP